MARVDPVTLGAVLLAVVTGVGEALGGRLWSGVAALVRRPLHRKPGAGEVAVPSGEAQMTALQDSPGDDGAVALAQVLLGRAGADPGFEQALQGWWEQAGPVRDSLGDVSNTISGGTFNDP